MLKEAILGDQKEYKKPIGEKLSEAELREEKGFKFLVQTLMDEEKKKMKRELVQMDKEDDKRKVREEEEEEKEDEDDEMFDHMDAECASAFKCLVELVL